MAGTSAGGHAGQVSADVVDDNTAPPAAAVATTPRAYLDEIRDDWLQPLIDQLKDAERTIGRVEAERDQAARERDTLRVELDRMRHAMRLTANDAPQDAILAPQRSDVVETTDVTLRSAQDAQRLTGGAGGGG